MAMSIRLSVNPSCLHFSPTCVNIFELEFWMWLCFYKRQAKFEFRHTPSFWLKELCPFLNVEYWNTNFSPTCFAILIWNFVYVWLCTSSVTFFSSIFVRVIPIFWTFTIGKTQFSAVLNYWAKSFVNFQGTSFCFPQLLIESVSLIMLIMSISNTTFNNFHCERIMYRVRNSC